MATKKLPFILASLMLLDLPASANEIVEIPLKSWPLPEQELKERFWRVVASKDPQVLMQGLIEKAATDHGVAREVMECFLDPTGHRVFRSTVLGGKGFVTFVLTMGKSDLSPDLINSARATYQDLLAHRRRIMKGYRNTALSRRDLEPLLSSNSSIDRAILIKVLSSSLEENVAQALRALSTPEASFFPIQQEKRSFSTKERKRLLKAMGSLFSRERLSPALATNALEMLESLKAPSASRGILALALTHPDEGVRYQVASLLAKWKRVKYIEPIFEALKDNHETQKASVMESFLDFKRTPQRAEPKLQRALVNAVVNAARKNPTVLRAVPYCWGNIIDGLSYSGRDPASRKAAKELSDNLFFFERTPHFPGKHDLQPLSSRLTPSRWVQIIKRLGSSGSPPVLKALTKLHQRYGRLSRGTGPSKR